MAKLTNEELLEAFKEMTLIELSEFVKLFEETFDVTAAAPVAMAAPVAVVADSEADDDADAGSDKVDVILTDGGAKKIAVIKEVRALTSLGLKEAKELVEGAPKPVLEQVDKETAAKAKEALEAAGGKVELK